MFNVLLRHLKSRLVPGCYAGCLILSSFFVSATSKVDDTWQVEGEHGQIVVNGLLSEGACRLDLNSVLQQIDLGVLNVAELEEPGSETTPVRFSIRLTDCYRSFKDQSEMPGKKNLFSYIEPLATITFSGLADDDFTSLLKVQGAKGIALKISDKDMNMVSLNQRGGKYFISHKTERFVFFVSVVKTKSQVLFGDFWAVANFKVDYE
ncbi:type 1 fimbria pilin [Pantoea sp. PNA 14-12]|uniref:fimbrial protein n=1 Tax=Pantoea TaxID=53335 RepID=UPI0010DEC04B|nr:MULTISPECIES: fimbrial protein [Pantoea]TDS71503.1 type 1 fimbria pilin [Pantoea sp. PNA 14-12]